MSTIPENQHSSRPESASAATSLGASADRPLNDPGDDRLGYAPFAEALARGIASMEAPDGLVISVYGAWGLGKTTVLNFVERYLEKERPDEFVVVRFNPWWFSGRVDIAVAFFAQLRAIFEEGRVRSEAAKKSIAKLMRLAGAASRTSMGDLAAEMITGDPANIPKLKNSLADALSAQDKRLLIVIDDIDRLTLDEIAELFSVVKALADFPNTIYVLAFDRNQVAKALNRRTGDSGFEYLEKIVQVPFELPLPERQSLRALFFGHLEEIVGETNTDLLDNEQLAALLRTGLEPLMTTPRDIVRLTNSLRVTYGAVRGEVNVADFVALEALRVFVPTLYDRIRERPELFGVATGLARAFPQAREDVQRAFHEAWARDIKDETPREAAQSIVGHLFPEVARVLGTRIGQVRRTRDARQVRAISEPEYFPIYFRFALGDQVLSRDLIAELVAIAGDEDAFKQSLLALKEEKTGSGRTRASVMLDELISQAETGISLEDAPSLIRSLIDIGDELWIGSDEEFMGVDNGSRIVWLIAALLERIPEAERCTVVEESINSARSVSTPVLLVRRIDRSIGVADEGSARSLEAGQDDSQALVPVGCATGLERAACARVTAAAAGGTIYSVPRLTWVIAEWFRWGDPDDVKRWFAENSTTTRTSASFYWGRSCRGVATMARGSDSILDGSTATASGMRSRQPSSASAGERARRRFRGHATSTYRSLRCSTRGRTPTIDSTGDGSQTEELIGLDAAAPACVPDRGILNSTNSRCQFSGRASDVLSRGRSHQYLPTIQLRNPSQPPTSRLSTANQSSVSLVATVF